MMLMAGRGDCDRALQAARNGAADVLATSPTSALAKEGVAVLGRFCVSGSTSLGGAHFENECFYSVVGYSGVVIVTSIPQKPEFNEPEMRKGFKAALKRWECREFVRDLLEAAKSRKNPLLMGGDIMALFETVLEQRGLSREKTKRSAGFGNPTGRIRDGDAGIYLVGTQHSSQVQLFFDTWGAFHETMHHAGLNTYYSDALFANIVHGIVDYRD